MNYVRTEPVVVIFLSAAALTLTDNNLESHESRGNSKHFYYNSVFTTIEFVVDVEVFAFACCSFSSSLQNRPYTIIVCLVIVVVATVILPAE